MQPLNSSGYTAPPNTPSIHTNPKPLDTQLLVEKLEQIRSNPDAFPPKSSVLSQVGDDSEEESGNQGILPSSQGMGQLILQMMQPDGNIPMLNLDSQVEAIGKPQQLAPNALDRIFPSGGSRIDDVIQGTHLADCWLLSAIAGLEKQQPGVIKGMFSNAQAGPNGELSCTIRLGDKSIDVSTSELPEDKRKFASGSQEAWPKLLELAIVKKLTNRSPVTTDDYGCINGIQGNSQIAEAMKAIFGGKLELVDALEMDGLATNPSKLFDKLEEACYHFQQGNVFVLRRPPSDLQGAQGMAHNVTVVGMQSQKDETGKTTLSISVRNQSTGQIDNYTLAKKTQPKVSYQGLEHFLGKKGDPFDFVAQAGGNYTKVLKPIYKPSPNGQYTYSEKTGQYVPIDPKYAKSIKTQKYELSQQVAFQKVAAGTGDYQRQGKYSQLFGYAVNKH